MSGIPEPGRVATSHEPTQRPGLLAVVGILLVVGLVGLEATIAFETYAVTTSLPSVVDDLDAPTWYSAAFAGTLVTSVTGMVLAGSWCDRVGALPPLLTAIGLFVSGVVMCTVAPSIAVFVAGRLVQGVGVGVATVTMYAIVSATVAARHRAALFGVINAAWVVPSLVGPLASGLLTEHLGWRWVYGTVAAVALVSAAVLLYGLRRHDTRPHEPQDARISWAWALTASTVVLTMSLLGEGPRSWHLLVTLVAAVAMVGVLARLLPSGTLRLRHGTPRLVALRGLLAAAAFTTEIYVPLYLQRDRGVSITVSGLALASSAAGWALGAWWQSADRGARTVPLSAAAGMVLAGPLATFAVVAGTLPWWPITVAVALMGLGMGLTYPQISARALALSPPTRHGRIGASLQLNEACCVATTLALGGMVQVHVAHGLVWTYAGLIGIGLLAVVAASRGCEADHAG